MSSSFFFLPLYPGCVAHQVRRGSPAAHLPPVGREAEPEGRVHDGRGPGKHWRLPFHSQEWSISKFPCSLTRNITSHNYMKNFAFHSLLWWKIIILPIVIIITIIITSLSLPRHTFLFKRLGECTFWTWEWKGQRTWKLVLLGDLYGVAARPWSNCPVSGIMSLGHCV